jgi:hypothetical protein
MDIGSPPHPSPQNSFLQRQSRCTDTKSAENMSDIYYCVTIALFAV